MRFEVAAYDRSRTLVIDPKIELVYSTYLGGSAFDEGYAIAVDDARSAYVTGRTRSADFPATHGTLNDEEDAFVTKFSPDGQSLVYSTLIGGTGGKGITEAYAIFVSSDGHAYITGVANTSHFPTTQRAFQTNAPAGGGHPFVSELTLNGQSFVYSSYVGSSDHKPCSSSDPGVDWGTGIDVEELHARNLGHWYHLLGALPGRLSISVFQCRRLPSGILLQSTPAASASNLAWSIRRIWAARAILEATRSRSITTASPKS